MKTKEVFEVFTIGKGKTYNDRVLLTVLTDEVAARTLAKTLRAKCSKIHAVLIDDKWHRYYARPLKLNSDLTQNKELAWQIQKDRNLTSENSYLESTSASPLPKSQSATQAT